MDAIRARAACLLVAGLMAIAGVAQAQTAAQMRDAVFVRRAEAPQVRIALAPADAEAHALKVAGIAKTAVDRRLASDALVGSLGFLCGLQPGAERTGAAAARGVDPAGRFVGAKLRLSFR